MTHFDVIVVGGGIAGVSIGYELSEHATVCLLERETTLAYHTTGRSAATFLETYGGSQVRALTTGSRAFFENPGLPWDTALMSPRPLLQFVVPGRGHALEQLHREVLPLVPDAELLTPARAAELFPLLKAEAVDCAMLEPGATELDVAALHQGYVRGLKARGAEVRKKAEVTAISRSGDGWTVTTPDEVLTAGIVVNAAGAWADVLAGLAGTATVGLTPRLRSIFMVNSPRGAATKDLPLVGDYDQSFYVKPEGEQFLCSPADETPSEPKDASADPLEIARAIEAINEATTMGIHGVTRTWGGLRSFVGDRNFVVGHADGAPGFFWFAGQGGYGIQTAPAAARLGAALALGQEAPADLVDRGLDTALLAPGRPGIDTPAEH